MKFSKKFFETKRFYKKNFFFFSFFFFFFLFFKFKKVFFSLLLRTSNLYASTLLSEFENFPQESSNKILTSGGATIFNPWVSGCVSQRGSEPASKSISLESSHDQVFSSKLGRIHDKVTLPVSSSK